MNRSTKRIVGNISVLAVIVALVAALVVSATSPTLLKSDAKLTAEANEDTPIVQAAPSLSAESVLEPSGSDPKVSYSGSTPALKSWANAKHRQWVDFYLRKDSTGFVGSSYSIYLPTSDGGSIWARNLEWSAPRSGQLEITVKGNGWTQSDLYGISGYVMGVIGSQDESLKSVVAKSENGKITSVADRNTEGV